MNQCLKCSGPTKTKFCSRHCANSYNNSLFPKRKRTKSLCKVCGTELSKRRSFCDRHLPNNVDWNLISLGDCRNKRKYQSNSRIRDLARHVYKKLKLPYSCAICNYDHHIEICHIKGISSFPEDATIAQINNPSNLVALCPNHHWEFDNGLIKYPRQDSNLHRSNYGTTV